MRIAQLCPYDIDRPGGVQRHILDLSAALRELGHQVTIIAPGTDKGPNHASSRDRSIVEVGASRLVAFNKTVFEITVAAGRQRKRLDEMIGGDTFDIIHFHTIHTPFLPFQAFRRSRTANVATFHDVPPKSVTGAIQRLVYPSLGRWLLPRLDGVILASDEQARHWPMRSALSWSVIPPCTNLSDFGGSPAPMAKFRDGRINILVLGRLEPRKGVIVLLQAFRDLCREGLPVRLLIAGDGPDRGKLEQFVATHAIPNVVFLGAVDSTPRWYATCDIFCAPALYGEGFGIVLVEAMASGCPVVAASNPGYRLALRGKGAQLLVSPGDVEALHAGLRALVIDPARRAEFGQWGRTEAAQFDCRERSAEFVAVYRQAVRSASQRDERR